MVTVKFNTENPRNFLAPLSQQLHGQPTKVAPPKVKGGAKPNLGDGSIYYSTEQGREDKCWRCGGLTRKRIVESTIGHNFQP